MPDSLPHNADARTIGLFLQARMADDQRRNDERHAQNTEKLDSILDEVRQVKQDVREQNGRVNRLEAFRDEHIAVTAERTKVFMKLTQTIDGMCKEQERVAAELATTKGEVKVRSHITAWIANNSGAIITGIIVGIVILVAKKLGW